MSHDETENKESVFLGEVGNRTRKRPTYAEKNEIKLREELIGPRLRKGKNLMEKICRQHTSI